MITPLTPLSFKRRAVELYGRKVGVVDGERRFTYAQFGERTNRLANALIAHGLRPGERVATLAFNCHALLEAYYGVVEAGGILTPLNIRLAPRELDRIITHAEPRFIIVDPELATVVDHLEPGTLQTASLIWLDTADAGPSQGLRYEVMLASASPDPPPVLHFSENDTAEIFYTSGTTGSPRGVMLTHRNLYLHALSVLVAMGGSERDVQLHTIALFHVNGWGTPQSLTAVGGRHVMLRKFDAGGALRLIEAERVTRFYAVPTMLNLILDHPHLDRFDLSSLELVNTGGAPTPPEMARRAEQKLGCDVIGGYGLSETSPVITFAADKTTLAGEDDTQRIRRRACTGMPVVGVELAIVDDSGQALPWDGHSVGEIAVRSDLVAAGYYKDPEATATAIRDGWLHTGDLATIDPEGYVLIVDRKKDIIVSGGENISSIEIEKLLFEHPEVVECAVVRAPDERWGEVPAALVVRSEGSTLSAAELENFCRQRLAGFKVPKTYVFVDNLPKGGTGKILKRELRDRYFPRGYRGARGPS